MLSLMAAVLLLAGCHNSIEVEEERPKVSSNTEYMATEAESPVSSLERDEIESSAISAQQTESGKPKPKPNPSSSAESNITISAVSSAVPSKPKPPTVSSVPSKPPVLSSSAPPAAESSAPQEPDKPEPKPPEERDPYAYPFDIEAIRQDLIEYGEGLGMKYRTVIEERYYDATEGKWVEAGTPIAPENSSWAIPSVISKEWKADEVKKELFGYLEYDFNKYHMTSFTIYVEPLADGAWRIYVLR